MIVKKINIKISIFELFKLFDQSQNILLDSNSDFDKQGRYSIIGVNLFKKFLAKDNKVIITILKSQLDKKIIEIETKDYLLELQKILNENQYNYQSNLPFIGGAIGFFSYNLNKYFEKIKQNYNNIDNVKMPEIFLNFYHGSICYDNLEQIVYLTDSNIDGQGEKRLEHLTSYLKTINNIAINKLAKYPKLQRKFEHNFSKQEYLSCIAEIKKYIEMGDIYQVNFTQCFSTEFVEDKNKLYHNLAQINPAPFASFIDYGNGYILSCSPERLIKVRNNIIEARPIKGTIGRNNNNPKKDEELKKALMLSKKDKAELLMIIDLKRNDLAKIAKYGTVKVPQIFGIETYATVHHLVSTIKAELKDNVLFKDILKAVFPGGSITGAPKISSMQIIEKLERNKRNIYTGSIGYIDFNGNIDLNIAIRTIICQNKKAYVQAGGAITWDSNAIDEYQESLTKAKALIDALNHDYR